MAMIKAGTYRFNDVLSAPSMDISNDLPFSVAGFVDSIGNIVANCEGIYIYVESVTSTITVVSTLLVSTEPDLSGYGFVYPKSEDMFTNIGGWKHQSITIPTDSEVSAEFGAWFNTNTVKTSKPISGTWKFNDSIEPADVDNPIVQSVSFISNNTTYIKMERYSGSTHDDLKYWQTDSEYDLALEYGDTDSYLNSWATDEYKTITFIGEQEVSEDFYNWFTANATPATASITYNGSTIASLFGGQTATLKCAGMKMETDVVVEVAEQPESFEPSGTINITENGEYAVYDYETAVVNIPIPTVEEFDGTITIV